MLQIIGLIVVIYAACRLIQAPVESMMHLDGFDAVRQYIKIGLVAGVSIVGLLALFGLTALLLNSGSDLQR